MNTFPYEILRVGAVFICAVILIIIYYYAKHHKKIKTQVRVLEIIVIFLLIFVVLFAGRVTTGHLSLFFFGNTQGPFEYGPELPLLDSFKFLSSMKKFEKIDDISYNPNIVPAPIDKREPQNIDLNLEAVEVLGEITPGTTFNYWTFNKHVPGPLLRARVGDNITISLTNAMSSLHTHSVDFHAVTGPGGGAKDLQVMPGETKSLTWKALSPGLYIYHCASKNSVAAHMTHGQYGLILIEPEEGLPIVDKEFYVVQGELYTRGNTGDTGLVAFDSKAMLDENPTYVVFNGKVGGLGSSMTAKTGETIRIFFGNGGVSKVSSFHVIGEIFDKVYPEGAIGSEVHKNVQSTIVPAGGATIVEFKVEVPGDYILVDHALARMDKGAWGKIKVSGDLNPEVYLPNQKTTVDSGH